MNSESQYIEYKSLKKVVGAKSILRTIERPRLKALIEEDLSIHPNSKMEDIQSRIPDVNIADLRKAVYELVKDGVLSHSGGKTYRQYFLAKKIENENNAKKENI
jgi:ATP-dependent DNA helicase RecG